MGVDYNNCSGCGNIFPDVMGYSWCQCGAYYCDDCNDGQNEKYGSDEDGELRLCDECNSENVKKRELKELERLKEKYTKGHSYDSHNRREFICPKCTWDDAIVRWGTDIYGKERLFCACKRCQFHFGEDVE